MTKIWKRTDQVSFGIEFFSVPGLYAEAVTVLKCLADMRIEHLSAQYYVL
jgi:hypothetical protein